MKQLVISNSVHPLFNTFQEMEYDFFDCETKVLMDYSQYDLIWDLTTVSTNVKLDLLMSFPENVKIVSEMSTVNGETIREKVSNIVGGINLAFYSPKETYEYFSLDQQYDDLILGFLKQLNLQGIKAKEIGTGFTFPRVIAQIVNEAYFSLEDELASADDIDTAMKFGVNYPLGPLEWSKKIGLSNIKILLDELYIKTKDDRYKASKLLSE